VGSQRSQGILSTRFVLLSCLEPLVFLLQVPFLFLLSVPVRSEFSLCIQRPVSFLHSFSLLRKNVATNISLSQKVQRISYPRGQGMPVPVQLDNASTSFGWGQESPYSSSSGYNSPNIAPGEFGNFYPHIPYGPGFDRTRTPSNASLHEPWSFPQSPSSSISMPYTWASSEKMPQAPLAYINASYPMVSLGISATMDTTTSYMPFDHKSMMQRDEEEAAFLFRDQPYGMGLPAHTFPSEQFLNNYWRLFHPTFPVVHRFSFENMSSSSSPLLRAAMIAIDGQYSSDMSTKKTSRVIHDRCIKLLAKVSVD
jgi:hypothetical protein